MKFGIRTTTGRFVSFTNVTADDIHIKDICYGLCNQVRYNGHVAKRTIADHSILVAELLPDELKPYGGLHDAHEAYTGEVITAIKERLKIELDTGELVPFSHIEETFDKAIYEHFGLPELSDVDKWLVKEADKCALFIELKYMNHPDFNDSMDRRLCGMLAPDHLTNHMSERERDQFLNSLYGSLHSAPHSPYEFEYLLNKYFVLRQRALDKA